MGLEISIGIASNPRTWPLLDGTVKPKGIDLIPSVVHGSELFWRQLRFGDFDASEMSFSSLIMALAHGDQRWLGIPVFTTRKFFHTGMLVRKDSGIETPEDLKGKRVGVPEYQQTAALWTRGVLQHEFGVEPKDMTFWMERTPDHSHGGATGFTPPPGVVINQIPIEKSIGSMMLSGELDATLLYLTDPNLVDRSREDLWNHPDIRPLFPSAYDEGVRYFRKTGIYPINHGQAIKREIAEEHPWVVESLFDAFVEANRIAEEQRREHVAEHIETGMIPGDAVENPIVRHGIIANKKTMETAAQYSYEQGLTPRLMKLDEVFAPELMTR
ncbi:MAG: PhnD/SsuA/transferrin family substrate-binding protein [Dehalococcoidia bacterium]